MLLHVYNPLSAATRALKAAGRSVTSWAYHAVMSSNKRTNPTGINRSEDAELSPSERAKLLSAGRDLHRNFAIVGWAVRKHLDYVASFVFQGKIADAEKNAKLEKFISKWSKKENFDVAGRHDLRRFLRLSEQRRTIDGDVFVAKLWDPLDKRIHGKVQAIEGDRIRSFTGSMPTILQGQQVIHGVRIDDYGAAMQYALHRRTGGGPWAGQGSSFSFERMLNAKFVYHHAYWDRFDQTRGISPLAAVYNSLVDLYESFDYALAKMKVSQLLGLIFYREASDSIGETEVVDQADATADPRYKVKFGKDPFKLELDPGDRAEFLESKSPSSEFQAFCQTMVALVLKAFDIPYSFYAENFSNYSGSRQALLQYEQSAENRRAENRDLLNDLTAWRLKLAIDEGDPDLEGITLDDLRWEWVASALPWIDPLKEGTANALAVDRGFDSVPGVCKAAGKDAFEIAKEQADFEKRVGDYREEIGLPRYPISNAVTYAEVAKIALADDKEPAKDGAQNATAA